MGRGQEHLWFETLKLGCRVKATLEKIVVQVTMKDGCL